MGDDDRKSAWRSKKPSLLWNIFRTIAGWIYCTRSKKTKFHELQKSIHWEPTVADPPQWVAVWRGFPHTAENGRILLQIHRGRPPPQRAHHRAGGGPGGQQRQEDQHQQCREWQRSAWRPQQTSLSGSSTTYHEKVIKDTFLHPELLINRYTNLTRSPSEPLDLRNIFIQYYV